MMRTFGLMPSEKAKVDFNERGQPIGSNSKPLSSYIGTLAREMVSVTIKNWKKIDNPLKDDLWQCIQSRFKIDAIHKSYLFKVMGQRWKESKSRLVKAIKRASTGLDSSSTLAMLKPGNVQSEQWTDFVTEKPSKKFEKKENATANISGDELWCKVHIKKNEEPPNSVVADCIAKIKEHQSSSNYQRAESISEDSVLNLFGQEHRGRVRGLRFGVVPSQMGAHLSNSKQVHALQNQVLTLEATIQEMRQEMSTLFAKTMNGKQNVNADDPKTPRAHMS